MTLTRKLLDENGTKSILGNTGKYLHLGYWFLLLLASPLLGLSQDAELEKIHSKRFKRLYQLNDSIYRSEQPTRRGFQELKDLDIRTAITLRRNKDDSRKAKGTGIALVHIPLKTAELTNEDLIQVLRAIQVAQKPVLVHCWHGSDRTGALMAAYRVVFENWSKEDALVELRRPELGYHENWYPNVIDLISNLDKEQIARDLGLSR